MAIDLGSTHKLAGIHLFTGFGSTAAIESLKVEFWSGGKWIPIPSADINGNTAIALAIPFDQTVAVETDKLRLWIPFSKPGTARVKEILIRPSEVGDLPALPKSSGPAGKDKTLWGTLEPYRDDAPDIVKLIHWGADVIVTQKLGHEMLKSQLAYFLYAWPTLKPWLPEQNHQVVRDYAFKTWTAPEKDRAYPYDESAENNLLALKTKTGTTKGCLPPGFTVEPNLMMHEVAKRENRPDADIYFDAAYKQTDWMVKNLDWNDPLVTKGQRMSEFITVTGLARFLREYPHRAP